MKTTAKNTTSRTDRGTGPRSFHEGWVHLCNGLDPVRDGGMVPSILGMTGALAGRHEQPVTIVTPTPHRLGPTAVPPDVALLGPEADLRAYVRTAGAVHIHGLWQGHGRRGTTAAREAGVPYVIATHGMADPWAMRQKRWKKWFYRLLIEGKNLNKAACLHALSVPEIGFLRALAPKTPVCLVPNGVDLAPFSVMPEREELEREYPELTGKFVLLFFGRLHAKKGLDLLPEALDAIGRDRKDVHLLLAGNDDGALMPFRDHCEALGITSRVTWVGHVSGERARQVWARADAFVLPSHSEGFSMAVLEALACRLPVLVTTACYFPELAEAEGGIVVEPTVADVTAGLRSLLERSDGERAELGWRGRDLVEREYTWDRQADRLAAVYRWIAGGGPRPDAVRD